MPIVRVEWLAGRSAEQKARVAQAITAVFEKEVGMKPESLWVTFEDRPHGDWYIAGQAIGSPPAAKTGGD